MAEAFRPDYLTVKITYKQMKNKKVLIVDDNDLNRKLFENLIGQIFSYESAKNGLEAVALTETLNFDLILMDIQMPKMDGISAMKKIREGSSRCPILAVTAYAEESDRESFLQQGFDDFITKPIRPREFLQLIQSYLADDKLLHRFAFSHELSVGILDKKIVDQLLKYNSESVIKKIFDEFQAECSEVETLIDSHSQGTHTLELIEKIHTLKGNSGTLGAMRIYASAMKAEEYGRKADFHLFVPEIKNLKNEISVFREFLKQETIFEP